MPRTPTGHRRHTLFALLALAGTLPAGSIAAETVSGSLAVTVEVVESCRVPAPSGLGTELAPCATGARARSGSAVPGTPAGTAGAPAARILVEGSSSGTRYLTTIH